MALGLLGLACGGTSYDPPAQPPHDLGEGHAARLENPFRCGTAADPDDPRGVPCPDTRPPDAQLSCDASGCHGTFDFTESATVAERVLTGSDGPSCYTCHDAEWE